MLLRGISQIDPLPRHPVRDHRVRDQEPNPVRGWGGKPEVIALEAHTLKSDRPSKRASRNVARLVTVGRLLVINCTTEAKARFPNVSLSMGALGLRFGAKGNLTDIYVFRLLEDICHCTSDCFR